MGRPKKQLKDILTDIYRDLYKHSTPVGDFDLIMECAEVDSEGRKIIPYNDYTIDDKVMDNIIEMHLRANRLNSIDRKTIKIYSYLGCSPKIKTYNCDE